MVDDEVATDVLKLLVAGVNDMPPLRHSEVPVGEMQDQSDKSR